VGIKGEQESLCQTNNNGNNRTFFNSPLVLFLFRPNSAIAARDSVSTFTGNGLELMLPAEGCHIIEYPSDHGTIPFPKDRLS